MQSFSRRITFESMAYPSHRLIQVLRSTAGRLQAGPKAGGAYQWGHMGACNCGHLAQTVTRLTPHDIHRKALSRPGDWNEQMREYCPTSGLPIDELITQMLALGLTPGDLAHLERLTAPEVLARLPEGERLLRHNQRDDVVRYMLVWADLLEEQLWAHERQGCPAAKAA